MEFKYFIIGSLGNSCRFRILRERLEIYGGMC